MAINGCEINKNLGNAQSEDSYIFAAFIEKIDLLRAWRNW